jgi:hypothetical protein
LFFDSDISIRDLAPSRVLLSPPTARSAIELGKQSTRYKKLLGAIALFQQSNGGSEARRAAGNTTTG